MAHQAMIIDLDRCVGCGACVVACEEEWGLPAGVDRNWVRPLLPVASKAGLMHAHYVGLCNHCGRASCIEACPTGATYRDSKGRVMVDADACIGCGHCVDACPYGARTLRADQGRVEKCDFCAPRVDAGLAPACVEVCPAGARAFGDLDSQDSVGRAVRSGKLRRLETAKVSIDPHVFYSGGARVVERILTDNPPDARRTRGLAAAGVLGSVRSGLLGLLGVVAAAETMALLRQLLIRREESARQQDAVEDEQPRLRRHHPAIIALHWVNALAWILLLGTGLAMLAKSRYSILPGAVDEAMAGLFGSRGFVAHLHIGVGVLWVAVLLSYGVFGFRQHLAPFVKHLRLSAADRSWLEIKLRRMLGSRDELPPQDKYNAGQKLFGLAVALGTVALAASGLVMLGLSGPPARWAVVVHFTAMAAVLVGLLVHVFMAAVLRSERPALWSMFHGWIPASHARAHNLLWWQRSSGKGGAEEGREAQR